MPYLDATRLGCGAVQRLLAIRTQQIPNISAENVGELYHHIESRVRLCTLHLRNVSGRAARPFGKLGLGQVLRKAVLFEPVAKKFGDRQPDVVGDNYFRHDEELSNFCRKPHRGIRAPACGLASGAAIKGEEGADSGQVGAAELS